MRSRFRLRAPWLMVNVSRVQIPCVIGAITDSHSDVLIVCFIFDWMILIVNISWIITGTKKEAPRCCDTSVYSLDRSIYQLPLQWAYRTLQPRIHPVLTFCSSVIMFIEYLMVLIVCGCKCRDFFLISNTSRQLFSRAKSLISKDIKFFIEAPFSRVKYRYNDSFHHADSGMCKFCTHSSIIFCIGSGWWYRTMS